MFSHFIYGLIIYEELLMATKKPRTPRIVKVTTPTGVHYVRALHKAAAIAHVVETTHTAAFATADDMLGIEASKVETAGVEE
jgi:hypothetical protein